MTCVESAEIKTDRLKPVLLEDEVQKISSAISGKSTSEELGKWVDGLSDEDHGRYKM